MISIVLMREEHLQDILKIEQKSFSENWTEKALKETINSDNYRFYCMLDNLNKVIGYVGIAEAYGEGEIIRVAIDEHYRKQGLGNYLLNEVINSEKSRGTEKLYLEVRESNFSAIRLYEKNGFGINGRRKNFYRKPAEDALLMSRTISY